MTVDTTEDVERMPGKNFVMLTSDDMIPEWAEPLAIVSAIGYYILLFFVAALIVVTVYRLVRLMKKKRELKKMMAEIEENKDE